jgi:hypothetical protein
MTPLHTARHAAEAHLICGHLETHGIAAVVRGEFLLGGLGELPAGLCQVWIVNDNEFKRADALLRQFLQGEKANERLREPWRCTNCGELLEAQFTGCWQCGMARPG